MIGALRAAGLPVGIPGDESADIICVVENSPIPKALVACPNGSVFRFEPSVFEPGFWAFAARNYYLVTGIHVRRVKLLRREQLYQDGYLKEPCRHPMCFRPYRCWPVPHRLHRHDSNERRLLRLR